MRFDKLTVEDLMSTALITLRAGDAVSHADMEMKLANVRHIPIVDDHQHVIGIVSNRDLYGALASGHKEVSIAKIMTREVVTVRPEWRAARAAELMLERKIGALPVVGDGGDLVGIVTETDFLEVAHQALFGASGMTR